MKFFFDLAKWIVSDGHQIISDLKLSYFWFKINQWLLTIKGPILGIQIKAIKRELNLDGINLECETWSHKLKRTSSFERRLTH